MDNGLLIGFAIPETVDRVVTALCADYDRREAVIMSRVGSLRVQVECRYLNHKIMEAASEVVGEYLAGLYIKEIGDKTGYAKSLVECVSESTYKLAKREIKSSIARRLHLVN
jgi:hypothetical protein